MYEHVPASFGRRLPELSRLPLALAEDDAENCPKEGRPWADSKRTVLLVARGGCNFTEKVMWAQRRGASGAIVYDHLSGAPTHRWGVIMSADNTEPNTPDAIRIPSVFVSYETGQVLAAAVAAVAGEKGGVLVTLNATGDVMTASASSHISAEVAALVAGYVAAAVLVIAGGVLGWLVVLLGAGLWTAVKRRQALRCLEGAVWRDGRLVRSRLLEGGKAAADWLKDATCSICLEEYANGQRLKILPCQHCFHENCVVPWLERRSVECPLCKQHALPLRDFSFGLRGVGESLRMAQVPNLFAPNVAGGGEGGVLRAGRRDGGGDDVSAPVAAARQLAAEEENEAQPEQAAGLAASMTRSSQDGEYCGLYGEPVADSDLRQRPSARHRHAARPSLSPEPVATRALPPREPGPVSLAEEVMSAFAPSGYIAIPLAVAVAIISLPIPLVPWGAWG